VQHLIIKPLDVGLETSMVVTTNRRSYHLKLRSHRSQYMPQVAFTYPEEAMAKWEAIKAAKEGIATTGRCRKPASTWAT
jgi:type IV secretory pathway VirB9-like protein